jgi:hypothetical protein
MIPDAQDQVLGGDRAVRSRTPHMKPSATKFAARSRAAARKVPRSTACLHRSTLRFLRRRSGGKWRKRARGGRVVRLREDSRKRREGVQASTLLGSRLGGQPTAAPSMSLSPPRNSSRRVPASFPGEGATCWPLPSWYRRGGRRRSSTARGRRVRLDGIGRGHGALRAVVSGVGAWAGEPKKRAWRRGSLQGGGTGTGTAASSPAEHVASRLAACSCSAADGSAASPRHIRTGASWRSRPALDPGICSR